MPCFFATSATGDLPTLRRIVTICSSVNRLFFMTSFSVESHSLKFQLVRKFQGRSFAPSLSNANPLFVYRHGNRRNHRLLSLPYLRLKEGKSVALMIPAALSLALLARLLTLHPGAAGRVYAAYGGVYINVALI